MTAPDELKALRRAVAAAKAIVQKGEQPIGPKGNRPADVPLMENYR